MTTALPLDEMIETDRGTIKRHIFVCPEIYRGEPENLFTRA